MTFRIANIMAIAEHARQQVRAPGLSMAAILPDGGRFACGLGQTHAGGDAVTENTLFGIGSLTKAQTALACLSVYRSLARPLAGSGFANAGAATLEDALSGRTGRKHLQEIPLRAVFDTAPPYIEAALRLPPDPAAGQDFRYSNAMFTLAGRVLANDLATRWDDALCDHVWRPLGMGQTRRFLGERPDVSAAEPHLIGPDGAPEPVGWSFFGREMEEAAGAVLSSASDMGAWLSLFAGDASDARRDLAAEALRPRISAKEVDPLAALGRAVGAQEAPTHPYYGLGWFLHRWRGTVLATHSGGFGGFSAYMAVLPERSCAVAMLANTRSTRPFLAAACLAALDELTGRRGADWIAAAAALPASAQFFEMPNGIATPRSEPAEWPELGRYRTDVLGPILWLERDGADLRLNAGRLSGILIPIGRRTFILEAPGILEGPLRDVLTFPGAESAGYGARFDIFRGLAIA